MTEQILQQNWEIYSPKLSDKTAPGWKLLYDEQARDTTLDETERVTMVLTLGHADTVRINADPRSSQRKGTIFLAE